MTRRAWPVLLPVCLLVLDLGVTGAAGGQQTPPPITEVNVQQLGPQRLGPLPPVVAPPNQPIVSGTFVSPNGDTNGGQNRGFYRVGGDLSLNWKTLNLQAMAFRAVDDGAFNVVQSSSDYTFYAGVVQIDSAGLPNNRLVTSAMYNWVRPPSNDDARRMDSYSALARYYLGSWQAVNVALHGEYTPSRRWRRQWAQRQLVYRAARF